MASVKIPRTSKGIPTCTLAVTNGETELGMRTIVVLIRPVDNFGIVSNEGVSLRLSPDEARHLADGLVRAATPDHTCGRADERGYPCAACEADPQFATKERTKT
jgi:hypothetical protein